MALSFPGHPVNQYHLMKRLKNEWDEMESMVLENSTQNFIDELSIKRSRLPNNEDIEGTARAIMRLQVFDQSTKSANYRCISPWFIRMVKVGNFHLIQAITEEYRYGSKSNFAHRPLALNSIESLKHRTVQAPPLSY